MTVDERLRLKLSAAEAIQYERQPSLSRRDCTAIHADIAAPFAANPALQDAMEQAHQNMRRRR